MAHEEKGKGRVKGNGAGESVNKSVYLFKVDSEAGTATVARMPFDTVNAAGEKLVRTSEDVIKAVTAEALSEYPERVQRALCGLVKQNVRSIVRGAEAFAVTEIVFGDVLDNLSDGKKAKPDEDTEVEVADEPEAVEPSNDPYVTPTQTW